MIRHRFQWMLCWAGLLSCGLSVADAQDRQAEGSASVAAANGAGTGTTIFGRQDSSVGLYLLPWKEDQASDLDRPPQHWTPQGAEADSVGAGDRAEAFNALRQYWLRNSR